MIIDQEIIKLYGQAAELFDKVDAVYDAFHERVDGLPGITEEDAVQLIRQKIAEMGITQKQIAEMSGTTQSQMSHALRGHRRLPFAVVLKCLEIVGYRLVAVPVELPFTPEKGEENE